MTEISKTTDKALTVLSQLTVDGPRTVQELSRETGIDRTVVYRLVRTLERSGFVHRREGRYAVSHRLRWLSTSVKPDLRVAADRTLHSVAERTGETTVLAVIDGDEIVVLFQVVPDRGAAARIRQEIGARLPLDRGAGGLVLLAYAERQTVARQLRASDEPDALSARLDEIRDRGYGLTVDDQHFGAAGLAVPVLDAPGHAVACLLVLVPAGQAERLTGFLPVLREAATRVAENLARR